MTEFDPTRTVTELQRRRSALSLCFRARCHGTAATNPVLPATRSSTVTGSTDCDEETKLLGLRRAAPRLSTL